MENLSKEQLLDGLTYIKYRFNENGYYYRILNEVQRQLENNPTEIKAGQVEPVVKVLKPTCSNCKHLGKYTDCYICNNKDLRLWNLSNCDINIEEWGCTYFEEHKA